MNSTLLKSQPAAVDIDNQIRRGKAVLRELKTTLEDLEDRRELAAARQRNAASPARPCVRLRRNWGCNPFSRG